MSCIPWTRPWFVPIPALVFLLVALGCREDAPSPTGPESQPALATTATTALAFWQLSAGSVHSCGVTTADRAYCWGNNDLGFLGDGTTTPHLTPVSVVGGLSFRQVSAGGHTCAVTTGYRAYCWGSNYSGQLGDGTTTNRLRPVAVAGGHQFRQVAAGIGFTCGVTYPDNRAYCWGGNEYGQLGNGATSRRLTPVAVAGGRQFRQVDVYAFHTCGVSYPDNQAFCWGRNNYGQLGDNTTTSRLTPRLVVGARQWRQVDVGRYHTCGVTQADRAFCWGYGKLGSLGEGKNYNRHSPVAVTGGLYLKRVTTGEWHTCGETTGNRAYCWGANPWGQVGDGTSFQNRWSPRPVVGGLYFKQVSAGGTHTCAKTGAAVAYCWGWNGEGQLGDGTTTYRLSPVKVAGAM
jgi:alpha-tubulin suppressor-like RCC1 family protein